MFPVSLGENDRLEEMDDGTVSLNSDRFPQGAFEKPWQTTRTDVTSTRTSPLMMAPWYRLSILMRVLRSPLSRTPDSTGVQFQDTHTSTRRRHGRQQLPQVVAASPLYRGLLWFRRLSAPWLRVMW